TGNGWMRSGNGGFPLEIVAKNHGKKWWR
ncbi:hypothetical protein Tco_0592044, partial [Tanacetum coccineum]